MTARHAQLVTQSGIAFDVVGRSEEGLPARRSLVGPWSTEKYADVSDSHRVLLTK